MYPKTEAQAKLLALAERLAEQFAVNAAQHDRDGSFPFEHIALLRESGYTAASVPVDYGGAGHGLDDIALAQIALARGDGSTALCAAMHLHLCGTEGTARAWPESLRARLFSEVVRDGALLNNAAAETELGSPRGGGRPQTAATPDGPGHWRIDGRKVYTTGAPVLAYFCTYVALEDGSGDTARVAIARDLPGVHVEETWDALGMRASGSHDVVFEDVPVSDDDFLSRRAAGWSGGAAPAPAAWFATLVGATSLGIAEAARDYVVRYARARTPTGAPGPIGSLPYVRERIGRIDASLMAARALLLQTAEDWEHHPQARSSMGPQIEAAKLLATNTAVEVAEQAMRIVGGVALQRTEPLERYFRDVRSGLVNPPIDARALETIAAAALDGSEQGGRP